MADFTRATCPRTFPGSSGENLARWPPQKPVHCGMVRMRSHIMCTLEEMKDGICREVYIVSYSQGELNPLPDKQ